MPTSGTYVHASSRFSFPERIGTFRRVEIRKYDQEGRDIGVGYNSPSPVVMTVYVYPGPKDFALTPAAKSMSASEVVLDSHFRGCEHAVLKEHPDAKLLGEARCKLVQGRQEFEGRKAVFSMQYRYGMTSQPSVSELYVFVIEPGTKFLLTGRQFVKYRATYPVADKVKGETELASFMGELVWPTK